MYREECVYCFDSWVFVWMRNDIEGGRQWNLYLSLRYLGFCTGVREHTRFHYEKTGHSLFLQSHRTELPTESNASTLTRLAIEPEPPKNYETDMKVRCEACKNVFEAEGFVGQGSD